VAAACVLAACGRATPARAPAQTQARLQFGPFAGYIWSGAVSAISARWRVPRILPGSSPGLAATWIGAEGGASTNGPFIQIGVVQTRFPQDHLRIPDLESAFWSDTVNHFRPESLFTVQPGDEIFASMIRAHGRWRLRIADLTHHASRSFATRQEGDRSFDQADWTQENVTNGWLNHPFPYPRLSPVEFGQIKVNGAAPPPSGLRATWMTPRGEPGYLGPTRLRATGFTIAGRTLSAPAYRYLQIADPADAAGLSLSRVLAAWKPHTSPAPVDAAVRRLLRALTAAAGQLSHARWPRSVQPLIRAEISAMRADARTFVGFSPRTPGAARAWLESRLKSLPHRFLTVGLLTRRRLGAPDVFTG
jgi:hypothetical protein